MGELMAVSVVSSPGAKYPDPDDSYSPGESYPEYRFGHLSTQPNPAYAMVRQTLAQLGLDAARFGTPAWNPLGGFIAPGSSVFILCNFVYHRRYRESRHDFDSKCIHGSVLRALCDYVLIATGPNGRVRFGNSPLQSCEWERVLADTGADIVLDFYRKHGQSVSAKDLRFFVAERNVLGRVTSVERREDSADAVEIAFGGESLLSEIQEVAGRPAKFRVSDYDPKRIEAFHSGRRHRYVIHRAVLESDVVISLSKLKTHEKVGITCGLKGFVGMVGHKDCLAHHRFGSASIGGDEYPSRLRFLHGLSAYLDWVCGRDANAPLQGPAQIADRTARRVLRRLGAHMAGAWWGNDTAWRMTLDLARIAHYAATDGTMRQEMQRRHLSLIDGIVGGEGDGPLAPRPVDSGALVFADDLVAGDRVAARLMGFDPEKIALLREASRSMPHPLTATGASPAEVVWNGASTNETALTAVLGHSFRPPSGWRAHLSADPQ
jgi:Domain of unknown function (DUF362)